MSDYNFYPANYTQFVNINEGSHKYLEQRKKSYSKSHVSNYEAIIPGVEIFQIIVAITIYCKTPNFKLHQSQFQTLGYFPIMFTLIKH